MSKGKWHNVLPAAFVLAAALLLPAQGAEDLAGAAAQMTEGAAAQTADDTAAAQTESASANVSKKVDVSGGIVPVGVTIEGIDVGGMTKEAAEAAVEQKVQEMGSTVVTLTIGDNSVTSTLSDLGYTWENTHIVDKVCSLGISGSIVERYKVKKDIENSKAAYSLIFKVDENLTRAFVENCTVYNTDPVEGSLHQGSDGLPYVEGGTDGLTLLVEESVQTVTGAIKSWTGGDLTIPLDVEITSPEVTYEELAVVQDVLGTATTDYSASSAARAVNVQNGCSLINATVVWPGEEFSVTAAVTPFTAENGYEAAPSYEENRVVDSYGGGICQVSTTLYNAVLKAELDVTARNNHTMMVNYVEPSKDAAIAEGLMDMAFVNNTDSPIMITGYCSGGQITFTIFGHETRDPNRTIEFESKVISQTDPTGIQMYPNAEQAIGYVLQTQSPHTGYSAELWKNIYYNGELQDSVKVNSSIYQAVGTIYDIGVKSDNAALTQAMYAAIATNDLTQVQSVIKNGVTAQSETTQTQTDASGNAVTDTSQTAQTSADGTITVTQ